MKFSIFTDIHYNPGVSPSGDEAHLEQIQKRAEENNCDFIVSGGDFTHGPSRDVVQNYLKMFNEFHIPSYHSLGNHDTDLTSLQETLKCYNMPNNYYYFDCKGYRMIICDPNYYLENGEYIHFDLGNYYSVSGSLRGIMPPDQLEWLRDAIDSAEGPCILISHESFEREGNGIHNLSEVRKIINDANKKRPFSVILCINGHHHIDYLRIIDSVVYLDLNSASFHFYSKAHDLFPEELCKKYSSMRHLTCFNEPLHAVITVEGTNIKIDGMEGTYLCGVRPEDTGSSPFDRSMRINSARVQSANITLHNAD